MKKCKSCKQMIWEEKYVLRDRFNSIFNSILMTVGLILFGLYTVNDSNWTPLVHLSIFVFLGGMLFALELIILLKAQKPEELIEYLKEKQKR